MSKKRKPFDPAEAERQRQDRRAKEEATARADRKRPEAWGVGADLTLPAHADTQITRDAKGRATRAFRSSVINALHRAGALNQGQVDSADRLAVLWAQWKGLEGKPEVVGKGEGARELVTDRMIQAGKRVDGTLKQLGPLTRHLVSAFMVAIVEEDRPMSWRGIVQRETGEAREKEQRAVAVFAFEELRLVSEGRIAA